MPTFDRSGPVLNEPKLERILDRILQFSGLDERGFQSSPSTAVRVTNYGITTFGSTGAKVHVIDPPEPTLRKTLTLISTSTLGTKVSLPSTAYTFDGTNHILNFDAQNDLVELIAISPTRYQIVLNTSVTASTA